MRRSFGRTARSSSIRREFRRQGGDFTDLVMLSCPARFGAAGRLADMAIIGRPVGELRRAYQELNAAYIDLKRAEQTLMRVDKMASLGRLVAGVAHELNNPVSFIYGNVHSLSRYRQRLSRYLDAVHAGKSRDDCEELRRSLKIDQLMTDLEPLIDGTREGALRVSDIVKNLRRLSFVDLRRAAEGQYRLRGAQCRPLDPPVGQAARSLLDDHLPEELLVEGTEGPLHQVFVNLMQNCRRCDGSGRPSGHLAVRTAGRDADADGGARQRTGNRGRPSVEDLRSASPPRGWAREPGWGYGCRWSIVRDHGGRIEVANSPEGGAPSPLSCRRGDWGTLSYKGHDFLPGNPHKSV